MRRVDGFKVGLAFCALILFALSLRSELPYYRYAALACLLAAFALRFVGRRP